MPTYNEANHNKKCRQTDQDPNYPKPDVYEQEARKAIADELFVLPDEEMARDALLMRDLRDVQADGPGGVAKHIWPDRSG